VSIETRLHQARERVDSERAIVSDKLDAMADFDERVGALSTARPDREMATVAGGLTAGATGAGTDDCDAVLSAFADTVFPHVREREDSVLEAVRAELGDGVARALAPTTGSTLTPTLQTQLRSAVESRQCELSVTETALTRERDSLDEAGEVIEECTDWLVRADVTPLSTLDFGTLSDRHDRLSSFQSRIGTAADQRQQFLQATTSQGGEVGVDHHSLALSLYEDFPVDHPVLVTTTRLVDVLDDCKAAVRDHLVRRA
jgi:hypothetical protein